MGPPLLNLRLHNESKERIIESFASLINNNSFQDILIVCSDGKISLDKLTVGMIFPFLGDIFSKVCSSEVVLLLPDYHKNYITENLKNITGYTIKQTNFRQFNVPKEQTASKSESSNKLTEDYIDNETYLETNTSKKQMNDFTDIIVDDTVENTLDIADAVYENDGNHETI